MAARLAQILLAIFSIVSLQINLCWGDALVDSGLDRTVNNTLQKYSELYPDIAFVVLSGGDNRAVSMRSLLVILGDNPSSLDYEHPEELREILNDVNLGRIERMLARGLPSATLFGIGATAKTQRPNLCVITLDVEWIAGTRERASHFLLSLPEKMDRKIPSEHWVDNVEFLHPHNLYLAVTYQGGLLGLALLVGMIVVLFSELIRNYDVADAKLALGVLSIAVPAYFLDGHELIDKIGSTWFLLWMPAAVALGLRWLRPAPGL